MSLQQAGTNVSVRAMGRPRRSAAVSRTSRSVWARARNRSRGSSPVLSAASSLAFLSSLCSSCAFSATCSYARRGNKPVLHCEEHA